MEHQIVFLKTCSNGIHFRWTREVSHFLRYRNECALTISLQKSDWQRLIESYDAPLVFIMAFLNLDPALSGRVFFQLV